MIEDGRPADHQGADRRFSGFAIAAVGWAISFEKMDGGGRRVQAFLRALKNQGYVVDVVPVGPRGAIWVERAVSSRLHRIKRRMFPVPFRGPVESELPSRDQFGSVISFVLSANRWALQRHPSWLDFPDLWSDIARNQVRTVDPLSAAFNRAQASLWSKREVVECARAEVVTVASWADANRLGSKAFWLPTPVIESRDLSGFGRRPSIAGPRIYGMIANFDYPPNRDAYERLAREWLPTLHSDANRVVVAGYGSQKLPRVAGIDLVGPVDDVAGFYDCVDIVLAPIERGGGMKVKVVEAMMHGVPVLATEHAVKGLPPAVAEECVQWGTPMDAMRDPRENQAVREALGSFSFESFEQQVRSLWRRLATDV